MHFDFLTKISKPIFTWVTDQSASDGKCFSPDYDVYCLNDVFVILLLVSLGAMLVFYYVVSRNATNATKSNMWISLAVGALVLVLATIVWVRIQRDFADIWSSFNMWKVLLLDLVYYVVLFELWAWLFSGASNARHLSIVKCLSK